MPRSAAPRPVLPEERAYDKAKAAEEAWDHESWDLFVAAARAGDPSTAEAVNALDRYTTTPLVLADEAVPLHMMQVRFASAWRSNEDDDAFEVSHQIAQARQATFEARWAARKAAGLDPRTGETVAQVRKREREVEKEYRHSLPDEGHYPDLLSDAPNGCTRPDEDFLEIEGPIRHTRFNLGKHGSTHHLRYFDGDEAVAGITFSVGPRGAATIERVFTDEGHRRQGYAKALLDYAKGYFRSVKHSKDLTGMGKAWKAGVEERLGLTPSQTAYRGSKVGDTRRITTGASDWDSYIFVTQTPESASWYGDFVEEVTFAPGTRTLVEDTPAWRKVVGPWKPRENLLQYMARAAVAARAAGYAILQSKRPTDVGTAVLHPEAIVSRRGWSGTLGSGAAPRLVGAQYRNGHPVARNRSDEHLPARALETDAIPEQYLELLDGPIQPPTGAAFRRWFKDSQVVDEDGNPQVIFHGTDEPFTSFDLGQAGKRTVAGGWGGPAAYFSSSPRVAFGYADKRGGRLMAVYLSIQNPLVVDAEGRGWRAMFPEVIHQARDEGHDGVIVHNFRDPARYWDESVLATTYVIFDPAQVKSATRNDGQYRPDDTNIERLPRAERLYGLPERPARPPLPPKVAEILAKANKLIGLPAKIEASDHNFRIQFDTKGHTFFRASTMGLSDWQIDLMPSDCREAWEEMGRPPVWIVQAIELSPDLREKGIGRLLYEALLHYAHAHGGIFGPNRCSGGVTSADARRVWSSLARTYTTSGPFIVLD